MTAYTRVSVNLTSADDLAATRLGGTRDNIPVIAFVGGNTEVEVALNTELLTPSEQEAWLLDLASKAQALAVQIHELHCKAAVTA